MNVTQQCSELGFRNAVVSDAPLLAEMNHQLICDEGHRNPMSVHELALRMESWLSMEYTAVLFELGNRVAGYALFRPSDDSVYVRQFFVKSDFRRQGIGRSAMQWLMKSVFTKFARVRLDVLAGNEVGMKFWRATGFTEYCITMEFDTVRDVALASPFVSKED